MKRKIILSILIIAVLFISCGIPNIYVPETGYSMSKLENGHVRFNFSGPCVDPSLVQSGFPTIYLFYQIIPSSSSSGFNNVKSKFESTFCNTTDGIRITYKDEQPFYSSTYTIKINDENNTSEYGIYQFRGSYEGMESLSGISAVVAGLSNLIDNKYIDLKFTYNEINNIVNLSVNDNEHLKFNLYRYDGSTFSNSSKNYIGAEIPEAYNADQTIDNYTLKIYAVVSFEFNGYNNIFNTKTYEVFSQNLGLL